MAGLEHKQATKKIKDFEIFVATSQMLRLIISSLKISAKTYGTLRRKGIQIGTPDVLIAGIVLDKGYDLITTNFRHYKHIDDLTIQNWKTPI